MKCVSQLIIEAPAGPLIDILELILYNLCHNYFKGVSIEDVKTAIKDTNYYFKYHQLGYEFINDQITRIDNKVLHQEAVKPAFILLSDPKFTGANEEMRQAYEARRTGSNADAIINANKAFESTMKSICTIKNTHSIRTKILQVS